MVNTTPPGDTRRGLFSREKGRYGALGGAYHRDDSRFRRHILLRRECDNHHPRLRKITRQPNLAEAGYMADIFSMHFRQ